MVWLSEQPPRRRPIVLVEDHLYHIGDALALIDDQLAEVLPLLTVVCLDRPGPDTRRSVAGWLERFPTLRVAAVGEREDEPRFEPLGPEVFERPNDLARAVASLLRPGGLMLQDIQLETLSFIPRDRWWESIYIATSVRGMFPERPPTCRFLSNKRGYEATFGCDLLDAGFDPRDVLDKGALAKLLVPILRGFLDRDMPRRLVVADQPELTTVLADDEASHAEIEAALDLVFWQRSDRLAVGGRAVDPPARKPRLELESTGPEAETWRRLVDDRFEGGPGVPVLEVGQRVAPELAGRAEITNCAARHIHRLRARLHDGNAIQTVDHAYRLDRRLRVGGVG